MNGSQLVDLFIEYDIGVKRTGHALIELINEGEGEAEYTKKEQDSVIQVDKMCYSK